MRPRNFVVLETLAWQPMVGALDLSPQSSTRQDRISLGSMEKQWTGVKKPRLSFPVLHAFLCEFARVTSFKAERMLEQLGI